MSFLIVALWVGMAVGTGALAKRQNLGFVRYFVLGLLFTPLFPLLAMFLRKRRVAGGTPRGRQPATRYGLVQSKTTVNQLQAVPRQNAAPYPLQLRPVFPQPPAGPKRRKLITYPLGLLVFFVLVLGIWQVATYGDEPDVETTVYHAFTTVRDTGKAVIDRYAAPLSSEDGSPAWLWCIHCAEAGLEVKVTQRPGATRGSVVFSAPHGTEVKALGQVRAADGSLWYAVALNDQAGYVPADLIFLETAIADPEPDPVRVEETVPELPLPTATATATSPTQPPAPGPVASNGDPAPAVYYTGPTPATSYRGPAPAVSYGGSRVTVSTDSNLRSGPGTDYAVVGSARAGQTVTIVGSNPAGDWYQLDTGAWIAAYLISGSRTRQPIATPRWATPSADTLIVMVPSTKSIPPQPTPFPTPPTESKCDPNYSGACIPIVSYDLDCDDVSYRDFQVSAGDRHDFDEDNDGIGCDRE